MDDAARPALSAPEASTGAPSGYGRGARMAFEADELVRYLDYLFTEGGNADDPVVREAV